MMSRSFGSQPVHAAEVGRLGLAHDYLVESALLDLDDREHNTRDGLHLAALAGTWIALVAGLAGMREREGTLAFAPRLPEGITRLAFAGALYGRRIRVGVAPGAATYELLEGAPIAFMHHGEPFTLAPGEPVTRPIGRIVAPPAPTQPAGREPQRRRRT